ncbi:transmembrane protein 53-like [Brachionichthys hirsutus]|uniref:transmembrane protein 53-like n=1 Tax=Brachionichthys hirsutus TaxID=412623 RepID=UPI00360469B7
MGNLLLSTGLFRTGSVPEQAGEESFTVRRISRGITYYHAASSSPSPSSDPSPPADSPSSHLLWDSQSQSGLASTPSPRPLLLFFPWLGARPGAVAKYRDLYLGRGADVLVVQSNVTHFLWPRWGLDYALEVLKVLEDSPFSGRTLLVHASSIGGYTFSQMLTHISEGRDRHACLAQRVTGQVFDSLVVGTLEHMAIGLGKTLAPRFEGIVKNAAMLYFWLFRAHTAELYERSIQVFLDNPITAPALFFCSEDDALCDQAAVEKCVDHWRKRGVAVESRKWKESIHAAHMRCHPADYLSTLDTFLNSLPVSTLEVKKEV